MVWVQCINMHWACYSCGLGLYVGIEIIFSSSFVVPCSVVNCQHPRLHMNSSICFERTIKETVTTEAIPHDDK